MDLLKIAMTMIIKITLKEILNNIPLKRNLLEAFDIQTKKACIIKLVGAILLMKVVMNVIQKISHRLIHKILGASFFSKNYQKIVIFCFF